MGTNGHVSKWVNAWESLRVVRVQARVGVHCECARGGSEVNRRKCAHGTVSVCDTQRAAGQGRV